MKHGIEFGEKMVEVGQEALNMVSEYFKGEAEITPKIEKAFKFLPLAIKIRHIEQHRTLTERSQAIRLLNFLPDDKTRQKYISMTQPQAAALLLHHPHKKNAPKEQNHETINPEIALLLPKTANRKPKTGFQPRPLSP